MQSGKRELNPHRQNDQAHKAKRVMVSRANPPLPAWPAARATLDRHLAAFRFLIRSKILFGMLWVLNFLRGRGGDFVAFGALQVKFFECHHGSFPSFDASRAI